MVTCAEIRQDFIECVALDPELCLIGTILAAAYEYHCLSLTNLSSREAIFLSILSTASNKI